MFADAIEVYENVLQHVFIVLLSFSSGFCVLYQEIYSRKLYA